MSSLSKSEVNTIKRLQAEIDADFRLGKEDTVWLLNLAMRLANQVDMKERLLNVHQNNE